MYILKLFFFVTFVKLAQSNEFDKNSRIKNVIKTNNTMFNIHFNVDYFINN